ncbi:secreted RxLR effector protein 161-like [Silene latifolia]|uniref:secreted RxLR effector protein 161-like n=1 Tax=Silene latifolia TaxID=37657 RepID=UPI003D78791A
MGDVDVILGLRVLRTSKDYCLSQAHYVEKILKKFCYFDVEPARTPFDTSVHLKKNMSESVDQAGYAKILGSVMYLMCSSRPNIAYSVGRLSRYTHNPGRDHWSALVRLLRYLKGTADLGLSCCGYRPVLEGYYDANWISESNDIHSTSGYIFTLAGEVVSWRSSKQTCIARSTMKSELITPKLAG